MFQVGAKFEQRKGCLPGDPPLEKLVMFSITADAAHFEGAGGLYDSDKHRHDTHFINVRNPRADSRTLSAP